MIMMSNLHCGAQTHTYRRELQLCKYIPRNLQFYICVSIAGLREVEVIVSLNEANSANTRGYDVALETIFSVGINADLSSVFADGTFSPLRSIS